MKLLLWLCLFPIVAAWVKTFDMHQVRVLYQHAAENKQDARKLDELIRLVDSASGPPVLVCYKGANEMIQAKYTLNPFGKLEKFTKGKALVTNAIGRDTLSLEMRFIRYSLLSNLPAFLGYHDEMAKDKRFLLDNTRDSKDPELKEMIVSYLSASPAVNADELKQLKN